MERKETEERAADRGLRMLGRARYKLAVGPLKMDLGEVEDGRGELGQARVAADIAVFVLYSVARADEAPVCLHVPDRGNQVSGSLPPQASRGIEVPWGASCPVVMEDYERDAARADHEEHEERGEEVEGDDEAPGAVRDPKAAAAPLRAPLIIQPPEVAAAPAGCRPAAAAPRSEAIAVKVSERG